MPSLDDVPQAVVDAEALPPGDRPAALRAVLDRIAVQLADPAR